jgi:hypothetical protein
LSNFELLDRLRRSFLIRTSVVLKLSKDF